MSTTIARLVAVACVCAVAVANVSASDAPSADPVTAAGGPSLAEISRAVETQDYWRVFSSSTLLELFGMWSDLNQAEGESLGK